jgi:hypothetical protein
VKITIHPCEQGWIELSHLDGEAGSAGEAEASASRSGERGEHDNDGNENFAETRHDKLHSVRLAKRAYCTSVEQSQNGSRINRVEFGIVALSKRDGWPGIRRVSVVPSVRFELTLHGF